MANSKIFGRVFFWSESTQNALTRIFKGKSRNRRNFPVTKFFPRSNSDLAKMVEKWQSQIFS